MIGAHLPAIDRVRKVGVATAARKARARCWSARTAIVVARKTMPTGDSPAEIELRFDVGPSDRFDAGEIPRTTLRGAELLYVEGVAELFRKGPGDVMTARDAGGKLLAFGLLAYGDRFEALNRASPHLYHQIDAGECWTEAHYVMPTDRNKRILGALLAAEREHLAARGYHRALAMIDLDNIPSLRAFTREGYRPTGTIRRDVQRFNTLSSSFLRADNATMQRWSISVSQPWTTN